MEQVLAGIGIDLSMTALAQRDAGAHVVAGHDVVGDELVRGAASSAAVPVSLEDREPELVLGFAVAVLGPVAAWLVGAAWALAACGFGGEAWASDVAADADAVVWGHECPSGVDRGGYGAF
jgi:hypothetical protein